MNLFSKIYEIPCAIAARTRCASSLLIKFTVVEPYLLNLVHEAILYACVHGCDTLYGTTYYHAYYP
jgi:hypothetical protein